MSAARDLFIAVGFDGNAASRELAGLDKKVDSTRNNMMGIGSGLGSMGASFETQMQGLDKSFTLWEKNSSDFTSSMEKKQKRIDLVTDRTTLLEKEINKTTGELMGATREFGSGTQAAAQLENQLLDLQIQLADNRKELERLQSFDWDGLNRIGQGFTNVGKSWSMAVTAPLTAIGGLGINTFVQLEDSFARVQKVTSGSQEEIAALRSQLRYLATDGGIPLAITDMYELGTAAGRVGIELENMELAVSTAAMLGTVTDLSADIAMDKMAQFSTVMQMPQESFDRLGATLVGLGNNMATTENQIMRMGARLTGMGNAVGMSESEVLGFSAAFSSLGINAEAGGSAFTTIMLDIQNAVDNGSSSLEVFASTAGKSVDEFSDLFRRDATSAFIYLTEGLGRLNDEGYNTSQILSEMGFEGINVTDMMRRASGAGSTLRDAIDLANTSWEENTALTSAAGKIYDTTASDLKILRNRFTLFKDSIGSDLQHQFRGLISIGDRALQWLTNLDDRTRRNVVTIGLFAAAIGPVLLGIGGAIKAVTSMKSTVDQLRKGFGAMKFAFSKGGVAVKLFTNPIGIAVLAIGALIAIGIALWKNWDKVTDWFSNRFPNAFERIANTIDWVQGFISNNMDSLRGIFDGFVQFFTGFFTLDFSMALEGLATIFTSGINLISDIALGGFNGIMGFFEMIIAPLAERFPFVFGIISDYLGIFKGTVTSIMGSVKQIFVGVIDFIVGVFTGDWSRAWQGVVNIFGGIFGTLGSLVKAPVNGVISIVNRAIQGINGLSVDIPDWVPFVGGKSFGTNIPQIPMLAKGTNNHKGGPAIVGEEGPELVLLPQGAKVIPNKKSMGMLKDWRNDSQKQLELAALMGKTPRTIAPQEPISLPSKQTETIGAYNINPQQTFMPRPEPIKATPIGKTKDSFGRRSKQEETINNFASYDNFTKPLGSVYPPKIEVVIQHLEVSGDSEISESTYAKLVNRLKEVFREVFGDLWEEEWYKLSLANPNITQY